MLGRLRCVFLPCSVVHEPEVMEYKYLKLAVFRCRYCNRALSFGVMDDGFSDNQNISQYIKNYFEKNMHEIN